MEPIKLTFKPNQPKKLSKVFIVDDSQNERMMMQDFFSDYPSLSIKEFPTGDECVKHIVMTSESPDLILIDYFLDSEVSHSKDGLEILVKLKEISPNSVILMHTSVENQRIIDLARQKGAMDYIVKGPEGYNKLKRIIENNFEVK